MINVFRKTVLLLLVFSFTLYLGCSSDESDVNLANQLLEKAYQSYLDGNPSQALTEVNSSLEHEVTSEALAFKSQVEYVLDDRTAAYDTLSTFEALYPDDGGDDLLRAYFLSKDSGDCDQILTNLETALNENYADMSCESYWEMVETEEGFSYFRNNCSTQYAVLEDMKTDCPTEETPGACKENVTKFQKIWLGPKLWVKNSDMVYLDDIHKIEAMIARLIPGWGKILAPIIKARSIEIKAKNKGCGVVLHWTWVTWGLITYWVTAQK